MPRDVSYSPHRVGGVTEHRVYANKGRPPAMTLGLLALHAYAAWRLWQADLSLRTLRSLWHWDPASWRSLVSAQSLVLAAYLMILLKISDQLVYGTSSLAGNWLPISAPLPALPGTPRLRSRPCICTHALTHARMQASSDD